MKPLLPTVDKLLPYLSRIDASRHYSNFGPLNEEYQERLQGLFGAPCVTASSATSALTATLMALQLPPGSLVAVPSWTFVATPAAIVAAGHVPYFVDVGDYSKAKSANAIVAVAPLGAPLDLQQWKNSKVPVVIDAAAGFDSFSTLCKIGKWPVIISTHATKVFGTGEGGFVTCQDTKLLEKIKRIINFGFNDKRESEVFGINAKLSEYHAAVGLAGLDEWSGKRERYLRKTKIYGLDYAVSLVGVKSGEGRKRVYGCHKHKAFKDCPRTELPVTEKLMRETFFVPVTL